MGMIWDLMIYREYVERAICEMAQEIDFKNVYWCIPPSFPLSFHPSIRMHVSAHYSFSFLNFYKEPITIGGILTPQTLLLIPIRDNQPRVFKHSARPACD